MAKITLTPFQLERALAVRTIDLAVFKMREARDLLTRAKARKAARCTARALHSARAALKNAKRNEKKLIEGHAKTEWVGEPGPCQICNKPLDRYFCDAKTIHGPWAVLCPRCFMGIGIRLGEGFGQKYEKGLDEHGRVEWVKVEG